MIPAKIPSLRQLRAFEAVGHPESIDAASRDTNLLQPGVTQANRALERQIGRAYLGGSAPTVCATADCDFRGPVVQHHRAARSSANA